MKVAEFCAGYNGLGMAVEAVFGAEPGWFSEYDGAPSKILAHHYPGVRNYGDMTKIKWAPDCPSCGTMCAVYRHADDSPYYWCGLCSVEWDVSIRHDDPDADIIPEPANIHSGGTPCQDLSAAGRRAGMNEGTRSNLWVNMREAVAVQRPKYVVWENVRGAFSACASSEMGQCQGCVDGRGPHKPFLRALGRVLGDLSDLGYDTQWRGLRAADVGACHGRFRVFVLARRRPDRYTDVPHVEGRGPAGRTYPDPEQGAGPDRSPSHGPHANADSVGHERPRDARGRWTRLTDSGEPAPDTEGIGRGEGWSESAGIERGLPTPSDSAPASDTNSGDDAGRFGNAQRSQERGEATPGSSEGTGTPADDSGTARGGSKQQHLSTPSGSTAELGELASQVAWGVYEAAIRRWERTIGRPAPRPTEPTGRNGGHRLSPKFTEWMMGLPDGWVTDPAIGISRNEQLKACGNGVVPQQAYAALSDMLRAFESNTTNMRVSA